MFGIIEKTARISVNVVTLPISVAADVVTLGGELNDRGKSYTVTKLSRITRDTDGMLEKVAG